MKFTSQIIVRPIASGILTIGALGLSASANNVVPPPAPTEAVELIPADRLQTATPQYLPITHWYRNKYWWKKNAPIIGGAAGGGLIGGLAGGGKGLIIGGAAGAGGGALYKHYTHHNHHNYGSANRVSKPAPNQAQPAR